ncbi:MAG: glucose-1-phosphate adenylyltransferase [Chitinivibrionia bacterium]|nr:glucose-1-phosphate adenylyltransferase [Chitinivibrionia bacterium]
MENFKRASGYANVLAMIMAGGEGSRLYPLTRDRAKPAVIFGGKYRIIDFVLNNFVNSGIFKIKVLTQFKADSLIKHLSSGWQLSSMLGQYIDPVPAQMRTGKNWYQGTADAIYQNLNLIYDENPDFVAIFGADHIYKMDISRMLNYHRNNGAVATVAAIPKPIEEASQFGVIQVDQHGQMIGFEEKPEKPKPMPGNSKMALCSMGNYIFNTGFLIRKLNEDAEDTNSSHDFGKNIIPSIYKEYPVYVYDFYTNVIPGESPQQCQYWEDVGTLEAYYRANMTLHDVVPDINLYNEHWLVRTSSEQSAPAKFVFGSGDTTKDKRVGSAIDSIICGGCIISGGEVIRSVLSRNVRVHSFAKVEDSIVFPDVDIGEKAQIRKAIIDKDVHIAPGEKIGFNLEEDKKKYFVSDEGIVVVTNPSNQRSLRSE